MPLARRGAPGVGWRDHCADTGAIGAAVTTHARRTTRRVFTVKARTAYLALERLGVNSSTVSVTRDEIGPTYIGLLRAVNLAGRNMVAMSGVRDLFTAAGMQDVRTLLQSGNVVFRGKADSASALEQRLQAATEREFGFPVEFFVRTTKEWKSLVAVNPFPDEAERDPGHLLVMFLKDSPSSSAVAALQQAIKGREIVRAKGRQAYVYYPDGVGRSKLTNVVIEQKLGTRATGRNWNTVLKLGVMAGI